MAENAPPIAVEVEVEDHNKDLPLYTPVKVKEEVDYFLNFFRVLIENERDITPVVVFYKSNNRMVQVITRLISDDEENTDQAKALVESLFIWPGTMAETLIVGFENTVMVVGRGLTRCIVISTVTRAGIYSLVFPVNVSESGEVTFEENANIEGESEPAEYRHMLAVLGHTYSSASSTKDLIEWLSTIGHEVTTFEPWTRDNIDARIAQ